MNGISNKSSLSCRINIVLYSMTNHHLWDSLLVVPKSLKSMLIELFHQKIFNNITIKLWLISLCIYSEWISFFIKIVFVLKYKRVKSRRILIYQQSVVWHVSYFFPCVMNRKMSLISFTIIIICEFNNPFFKWKHRGWITNLSKAVHFPIDMKDVIKELEND